MKVLVVDDCQAIRILLRGYLEEWGFEPVDAASGQEAMDIIHASSLPGLMIVDWIMPEMQGPELIREVRRQDPNRDTYIVMLTSKKGREALETAFRCGADDYMAKPIAKEELQRRVCEGRNIIERQDAVQSSVDQVTRAQPGAQPSQGAQTDAR